MSMDSVDLKSEVAELQKMYGSLCRLSTSGPYYATVDVRKINYSLNVKFQISESYPYSIPVITTTSPSLGLPQKAQLIEYLTSRASTLQGTCMIALLVEEAYQWCLDRNINLGPSICPMP